MIVEVFAWVAIADAISGVLLALAVYWTGKRSGRPVTHGQAVGLAILFGLPATLLYLAVLCLSYLGSIE